MLLRGTGMLEEMGTGVPDVMSHGCHESWNKEEEPQTILYITNKRLNISMVIPRKYKQASTIQQWYLGYLADSPIFASLQINTFVC